MNTRSGAQNSASLTDKKGHPWQDALRKVEDRLAEQQEEDEEKHNPFAPTSSTATKDDAVPRLPLQQETAERVTSSHIHHHHRDRHGNSVRSRRRPRVGIIPSAEESNLDSLEMALQDTSKASSSSVSVSTSTPGTHQPSSSTSHSHDTGDDKVETELVRIHYTNKYQHNYEQSTNSKYQHYEQSTNSRYPATGPSGRLQAQVQGVQGRRHVPLQGYQQQQQQQSQSQRKPVRILSPPNPSNPFGASSASYRPPPSNNPFDDDFSTRSSPKKNILPGRGGYGGDNFDDEYDDKDDDGEVFYDAETSTSSSPVELHKGASNTAPMAKAKNSSYHHHRVRSTYRDPRKHGDVDEDSSADISHKSPARSKDYDKADFLACSQEEQQNLQRLGLHVLSAEATSQDDIAWRNALYLLGMRPRLAEELDDQGRTALHAAFVSRTDHQQQQQEQDLLGIKELLPQPPTAEETQPMPIAPPSFIIQALLIANPAAVQRTDSDGRLPIHCIAASSGDSSSLQLLVEAHPASITVRDAMGWTPLHLLLLNTHIQVTKAQVRILLGMTLPPNLSTVADQEMGRTIQQRRGDHLYLKVEHLSRLLKQKNPRHQQDSNYLPPRRTSPVKRYEISEEVLRSYPEDIRICLKRLAKWERKKSRREKQQQQQQQQDSDQEQQQQRHSQGENDQTRLSSYDFFSSDGNEYDSQENNPAAIGTLAAYQLPLHIAVRRGLVEIFEHGNVEQAALRERRRRANNKRGDEIPSTVPKLQKKLITIVRELIYAFPEALIARDFNGQTPLIIAMTATTEVVPNLELIELLLGKRTAAYGSLPSWVEDAPLPPQNTLMQNNRGLTMQQQRRHCNPAMVPTLDTCQLPLHVAAEEWGDCMPLIRAIYESYPGGIHVQDARGRMPLHVLLQNYRRISPDPQLVALLLSDRVARTHTDEGDLPFDLLIGCASYLPKDLESYDPVDVPTGSSLHPDPLKRFKYIFQASIVATWSKTLANGVNGATTHNAQQRRAAANAFLWRLRSLPPWLRRLACSAPSVQEVLVEELSSPMKCAFVFAQGLVLALLLVCFRRQIELFIETASVENLVLSISKNTSRFFDGEIMDSRLADPSVRYEPWNTLAIYGLSAGHISFQAIFWALSASMNEFQRLCLFNLRRWIDLVAVTATVLTTVMIQEGFPDDVVFILGTVSTGMLWCSVIAFLSDWWYGMAFFTGSIVMIGCLLVWPILVAGVCVVAFAEMFYTLGQVDCARDITSNPICSLRDAYQLVYFLLLGEPIVDLGSAERLPAGLAILLAIFSLVAFLGFCCIALVVASTALNSDREKIALDNFWEPKLAFVLASQDTKFATSRCKQGTSLPQPGCMDMLATKLEELWGVCVCLLLGIGKRRYWYAMASSPLVRFFFRAFACLLLPIWLAIGCATLGVLWPPQVRRFIFRPWQRLREGSNAMEGRDDILFSQVAGIRNEITKCRDMVDEQSNDIHDEIRQLRAAVEMALTNKH